MAYIGTLAQTPDGRVYAQGDDGLWHYVSGDVFAAYGLSWGDVNQVDEVPGDVGDDEQGPPSDSGGGGGGGGGGGAVAGTLAGVISTGGVYIEDGDGVWHHIPDPATFAALGLSWGNVNWVDALPGPVGDDAGVPASGGGGPPVAGTLAGVISNGNVYIEDGAGGWHWIPDIETFNGLGLVWTNINWVDQLPGPIGDQIPSQKPAPPPPAPAPPPPPSPPAPPGGGGGGAGGGGGGGAPPAKPKNPIVSVVKLANGATLTTYADGRQVEQLPGKPAYVVRAGSNSPSEPSGVNVDEPVPKSVGEAIAAYLKAGATPAQAAAAAAPLAQSQADQGFSDPITIDALTQEAMVVRDALVASGEIPPPDNSGAGGGGDGGGGDGGGGDRGLQGATPNLSALVSGGTYAGIDNGIDVTGGPFWIYALANGTITRSEYSGSGWPGDGGLLVYRMAKPHGNYDYVYMAEDMHPAATSTVGKKIKRGDTIAVATGSNKSPGIECGFADADGHTFHGVSPGVTQEGRDFLAFVVSLAGGAKAPPPPVVITPTPVEPPAGGGDGGDSGAPGPPDAPAGVQTAWSSLIDEISKGVPSVQSAIQSTADSLMGIFQ